MSSFDLSPLITTPNSTIFSQHGKESLLGLFSLGSFTFAKFAQPLFEHFLFLAFRFTKPSKSGILGMGAFEIRVMRSR